MSIGISWDTDRPSGDYVVDVLDCFGQTLALKDVSFQFLICIDNELHFCS